MSLSIDQITTLAALGRAPFLIATALEAVGADAMSAGPDALLFDVDVDTWAEAYGLKRLVLKFPGLHAQVMHARVAPGADQTWRVYESRLTVSFPDHAVRAVVEGTEDMGHCHCDEDDDGCLICEQRGEFHGLEEALEEFYRPLIAEAVAAAVEAPVSLLAEESASALEEQVASELRDMDPDGQYVLRL